MTAPPRQRHVLFLIADTGAGHRSAANAIHHAMRILAECPVPSPKHEPHPLSTPAASESPAQASPPPRPSATIGWDAQIVDAIKGYWRFPLRNGIFLYGSATRYTPRLYGQLYRMTNRAGRIRASARFFRPFIYDGLARLFLETQPDVIVSVHPLLNHLSLQVLRDLRIQVPFVTVVTDLVDVHYAWIAPGVTACVVPTEAARQFAIAAGMPARRVHLLGMPIDPKFAQPPTMSRETLRTKLGLDPHLLTVLLVGGGEGAIGLESATMTIGESDLPLQLIVVTGRNKPLHDRLQRIREQLTTPAQILGFVHNMPDLMHAADIIVTKAGPGTITEAMACGLPIILTGAVPGQEEGNIEYVVENRLGLLARSPEEVVGVLRELLAPESALLAELRSNVCRLSRPKASFAIARLILKQLPDAASPSAWSRVRRSASLRGANGNARSAQIGMAVLGRPGPWLHRRGGMRARNGRGRRVRRLSLRRLGRRANGQLRRLPGLAHISTARALLVRGSSFGKVQLRRPGGGRRRHDAGSALRGGGH